MTSGVVVMLFQLLGILVLVAAGGVAWRWGGLDERLAAFGFVVATLLTTIANRSHYLHMEAGVLAIDVLLLAGLLILALRSDRFWPIYATAFQLVAVTVHVASLTETGNFAWAYAVALIFWSYPVMLALMAGSWFEARFRPR